MFQTQYPQAPPQYFPPDYHTPPSSASRFQYWSPRQFTFSSSPTPKEHVRRATQDFTYTSTPPKKATYYSSAETPISSQQQSSRRKTDYVSDHDRKSRKRSQNKEVGDKPRYPDHYSSRTAHVYHDDVEVEYEYLPRYEKTQAHPPPYQTRRHERTTDVRYTQVPIYTSADIPAKPRVRRSSYSSKPTYTASVPKPRPSTANKAPRQATEYDARVHHIPAGYSYKNWNPDEEPILLLGSVFDANSLGKWIYDWTVYFYGPSHPISEIAGELWLLLIQLAGKVKSAEDVLGRVRQQANRDMVEDFLDSGERLWQRFNSLLKVCENFMWKAAKREAGSTKNVTMGKTSGGEFVDSIFGRDRELERTEKLMTAIRLWSMRYAANVDPILANPTI